MLTNLYSILTQYGSHIMLKNKLKDSEDFVKWTEENFNYVRYNPRKNVDRWGLSITSLDGGVSGLPDLDSLKEYNKENMTTYTEREFNKPTPVFDHPDLRNFLQPVKNYIFRSHILKLNPGGYFPPHRDFWGTELGSFRIVIPLKNIDPPGVNFILEDKILNWKQGHMYFLNTAKVHYTFNASFLPSYWMVLNLSTQQETVDYVISNIYFG